MLLHREDLRTCRMDSMHALSIVFYAGGVDFLRRRFQDARQPSLSPLVVGSIL